MKNIYMVYIGSKCIFSDQIHELGLTSASKVKVHLGNSLLC